MIKFKNYLNEATQRSGSLHVFDIDDTIFHTTARIHVKNKMGKIVKSLSNSEFNMHKLPANHSYDFSEFRSAGKFAKESKPIIPMIKKIKSIHKNIVNNYPNSKIIMNTARTDFNNRGKLLMKFHQHGIPIKNIHVYRAGNETGVNSPGEAKNKVLRRQLDAHPYKRVAMYDDSHANLKHFLKLKQEYPHTEFYAYHAKPNGSIQRMKSKDYEDEKI